MSTIETLQIILFFVAGFAVGGSAPGGLLYLVIFIKHNQLSWKLFFGLILRVLLVLAILFALLAFIGIYLPEPDTMSDSQTVSLGLGGIIGFVLGVIVFIKGLWSALRSKQHASPEA